MKKADTTLVTLNDLLKINTDRIERYKKASYAIPDSELKSIFYAIADESRRNITDISKLIINCFGNIEMDKSIHTGKIYRSWQELKSKFNGTLRNNLLNSCEFGELAALSSYTMAQVDSTDSTVLELIVRQHESLKASLEVIKSYRQAYDRVDKIRL